MVAVGGPSYSFTLGNGNPLSGFSATTELEEWTSIAVSMLTSSSS